MDVDKPRLLERMIDGLFHASQKSLLHSKSVLWEYSTEHYTMDAKAAVITDFH
jgi:hypothetical protein